MWSKQSDGVAEEEGRRNRLRTATRGYYFAHRSLDKNATLHINGFRLRHGRHARSLRRKPAPPSRHRLACRCMKRHALPARIRRLLFHHSDIAIYATPRPPPQRRFAGLEAWRIFQNSVSAVVDCRERAFRFAPVSTGADVCFAAPVVIAADATPSPANARREAAYFVFHAAVRSSRRAPNMPPRR